MLSPTQQSYALIATQTALFTAEGFLRGYLASRIDKSDRRDKDLLRLASYILPIGACATIAFFILPSHEQIWHSAYLCDAAAPGAKKYLIEYIDDHASPLGLRTVFALSKEFFDKYVTNAQFYSRCSAGFISVAIIVPAAFSMRYFGAKID